MFQCDKLIYIQMQKTGCTHIASLLSNLFDGELIGKHNSATQKQIATNKFIVSSIRNPWDWYLSLWAFGVQGNGTLMHRLTKRHRIGALKSSIRNPINNYSHLYRELFRDIDLWHDVYDRNNNVELFRQWLKLIHNPNNSQYMGEGYGDTAITKLCGFMTYRYLRLCCINYKQLSNPGIVSNYEDLMKFENINCYINYFIRQESLEDDLCIAIEKLQPLSQKDKNYIYAAKKINTSNRKLTISEYYDDESIEVIRNRDRLIIEKFNYFAPQIINGSSAKTMG